MKKYCPKCGEVKWKTEFSIDEYNSSGLRGYCKPCEALRSKEYYEKHKEQKALSYQKRLSNPKIREEYRDRWRIKAYKQYYKEVLTLT